MKTLLEVEQLEQRFGQVRALNNLSFSMKEGEIICILGPSGCGKSTLLQLVAGLQQPYVGSISIDGALMANSNSFLPPEKRLINMVFQDYALWPHMNVHRNISYGLKIQKQSKAEISSTIEGLLNMIQLKGLANRLPFHLSGGQQQRMRIASGLATKLKILLMDEPLSNLDVKLRLDIRNELSFLLGCVSPLC